MVEPQDTANLGDATPGDTRGDGLDNEGQNPYHTPQAGTPVSLVPPVPPGWGDTPVLPGAGTRSVPIGGMEYFSKVFSHVCVCVCVCARMYLCIHTCMCVYIYIYTYIVGTKSHRAFVM